jgi:MerR family mercuric resistance operon transcriptional regulator
MRIGKVAKKAGVGAETIRFYERKGLIKQPRQPSDGGYRSYTADRIERVRFIRHAQRLGYPLKEIEELLFLRVSPETDCDDVRERAQMKLDEVNGKIAGLSAIRSVLKNLIHERRGQGPTSRYCPLLDALSLDEKEPIP